MGVAGGMDVALAMDDFPVGAGVVVMGVAPDVVPPVPRGAVVGVAGRLYFRY